MSLAGPTHGPPCRLLLVSAQADETAEVRATLACEAEGAFHIAVAGTLAAALAHLSRERVDAVLTALRLPDSSGPATVEALARAGRAAIVVLWAAPDGPQNTVRSAALHAGAQDMLDRAGAEMALLGRALRYAVERSRAQEAHRQVRSLIEANPDAVLVVDDGGTVRYVNAAAVVLFARPREELVGEWLGFSVGGEAPSEITILGHAEPRIGEVRVAPIEWEGRPALLASVRDVTEPRRLQEELRRAQKMEAVGLLAGGIAHDFNNVLVVIMGNAEFLLEDCPPGDPRRELVHRIRQAAERAHLLTRQLLVFSQRQPSRPVVLDPSAAVVRLHDMMRRTLPESIEFVVLPAREPCAVRIDPGEFDQVLMNLVMNARHAMPEGGRLVLAVGERPPASPDEIGGADPHVTISVRDSGTGIAPEHLSRIFDPFFTTRAAGTGTGLGLAICQRIVARSGGQVTVESTVGEGSTFTVRLPRCAEQPDGGTGRSDDESPGGRERILLAEDDGAVAAVIADMLVGRGYAVVRAGDGEHARRIIEAQAQDIDLVVSDVVMPRLGGRELSAWLAHANPTMRMLLMTGYAHDTDALAADVGLTRSLIAKPFLPAALLRAVRDLLDG